MDELEVVPEPEYDVDVRETIEELAEERGLDLSFREYEQPMLSAYTRRPSVSPNGASNKFVFDMPADMLVTQEELEERVEEHLDDMEASIANST